MLFRPLIAVTAIALLPTGGCLAQGVIEGRVELLKSHSVPVVTKRYEVITKGGVIATNPPLAVVYLAGDFPKPASLPVKQVIQRDLTFNPAILPVQVGTKVEFPNQDDTYHNIFSYSPAKRFDLGRYRPEERPIPSQIFDSPGLITLRCEIHEHMRGLILVLETPYFATTDAEGRYRITGVPPGRYSLRAWVSSKTTLERAVDVKAGAPLHIDLP